MAVKQSKSKTKKFKQLEQMLVSDLETIRLLADPLRIRLLEVLQEPRTTKQVADLIGEKPTKLYHHVDALEKAGLIRQTETRQNRGTLEKYYQAVAGSYRADMQVAGTQSTNEASAAAAEIIKTILESTGREIQSLADNLPDSESLEHIQEQGVMSFLQIRTDEKSMRKLRAKLMKLVEDLAKLEDPEDEQSARTSRLTLAFYPLDI